MCNFVCSRCAQTTDIFALRVSYVRRTAGGLKHARVLVLALILVASAAAAQNPEISAVTNGASFAVGAVAPEMIVSIFGTELANRTASATVTPLPTSLGGSTFTLTDSTGTGQDMPLFFVSDKQVNAVIPAGTALGDATITVTTAEGGMATAAVEVGPGDGTPRQASDLPLQVASLAPGLFSADATGEGVAAALVLRVKADGSRTIEPVFDEYLQALPIDLGDTDEIYLELFGTGIRGYSSAVQVKMRGEDVPLYGAQAQGEFVGLDQVNAGPLPRTLAGRGEVPIELTADGLPANAVTVVLFSRFAHSAQLAGGESVPPVGTPASGSCLAELHSDGDELTIRCTHDVAQPVAAHVHMGPPGEEGPIICNLGDPVSPIQATCFGFAQFSEALAEGNLYVNIHSSEYPYGEIRGQLY